jgi:hypothetical protein
MVAAETEIFRLSVKPTMGIVRYSSARDSTCEEIPGFSEPKTRAVLPFARSKLSSDTAFSVWNSGYNAVSLSFQSCQCNRGIVLERFVTVEVHPFGRSMRYAGIYLETILIFNNMYILKTETIAGTQHGAGILGLVNIFEDNGYIMRSVFKYLLNKSNRSSATN